MNEPIRPIDDIAKLSVNTNMIDQLFDYELSIKIILGSMNNLFSVNPMDYCYSALNIKALPLIPTDSEYEIIETYLKNGNVNKKLINIYAVERREEAERFTPYKNFKNRLILWHGTRMSNFMGILAQGLRIAPPEAPATGYNFGKGIYFADMASKSYSYTRDYSTREYENGKDSKDFGMMLLCEVALGETKKIYQPEYVENLEGKIVVMTLFSDNNFLAPYNSVMGMGSFCPNPKQKIVLANGAKVPCGKPLDIYQKEKRKNPNTDVSYSLSHNEYIVYKTEQVRIRYVVQVI